MCRLMGFIGSGDSPQLLADIVLWPQRSIIKQSYDARERKGDPNLPFHLAHGSLNGDGFGIGWFSVEERRSKDPTPCVFTSITPAWNNENLARLACKIVSPLIFAHVRAAYPGMPVSEQNCHPFMFGRYLWMHNGVVAGFAKIKRALLSELSDVAYNAIQSFHSDSAVSFALFLHHLPDPFSQQPPDVLLKAMQDTILTLGKLQRAAGVDDTSLLNYVVSDGSTLIATRFVSPETADAASLYYAEGAAFVRSETTNNSHKKPSPAIPDPPPGSVPSPETTNSCCVGANGGNHASSSVLHEASYELKYGERGARVAFVASEPITSSSADWVAVPKNMALVIVREKGGFINVMRSPLASGFSTEANGHQQQNSKGNGFSTSHGSMISGGQTISEHNTGGLMLSNALAQTITSQSSHGQHGPTTTGAAPEVAVCLEAISRGLAAKSRPWQTSTTAYPGYTSSQPSTARQTANADLQLAVSSARASGDGNNLPSRHHSTAGEGMRGGINGHVTPRASYNAATLEMLPGEDMQPPLATSDEGIPHVQRLVGHTGPVLCMVLDEAMQRMYTASVDCTIKIWSLIDNRCLGSVTAGTKPITAMQLQGRWLYSSGGRKMRVWDTERNLECVDVLRIANHCGTVRCLLVQPGKVFLGCQDASIKSFKLDEDKWQGPIPTHLAPKPGTLSRRNSLEDTSARDPDYTTPLHQGHVGAVNALAVSTNGELIISASCDAMIRVWKASDLSHVRTLRGHRGTVLSLLVVENLLVSGARDNTIRVWDLDMDLMCRCTLTGHKDDVTHLTSVTLKTSYGGTSTPGNSSGGRAASNIVLPCTVVASASADGTVRLWSLTWSCLCVLALPTDAQGSPLSFQHSSGTNGAISQHDSINMSQQAGSQQTAPGMQPDGYPSDVITRGNQSIVVPAVLCCALTGSMVCAGYSDGELKVWPCAGLHLAALQLVASDMGLAPLEVGTAGLGLAQGFMPSSLLSPYHPLMSGHATPLGLQQQPPTSVPGGLPVPSTARRSSITAYDPDQQTLAQANISQLMTVLSNVQANAAKAATGGLAQTEPSQSGNVHKLGNETAVPGADVSETPGPGNGLRVTFAPEHSSPASDEKALIHIGSPGGSSPNRFALPALGMENVLGSSVASGGSVAETLMASGRLGQESPRVTGNLVKSSGSHHLDKQMMHSLGEMIMHACNSEATTPKGSLPTNASPFLGTSSSPPSGLLAATQHLKHGPDSCDSQGALQSPVPGEETDTHLSTNEVSMRKQMVGGNGHLHISAISLPPVTSQSIASVGTSLLTQQLAASRNQLAENGHGSLDTQTASNGGLHAQQSANSNINSLQDGLGRLRTSSGNLARVASNELGKSHHVDLTNGEHGNEQPHGLGHKGAFGSFMGVDQIDQLARNRLLNTAGTDTHSHTSFSSTVLESCDEMGEETGKSAPAQPPHFDSSPAELVNARQQPVGKSRFEPSRLQAGFLEPSAASSVPYSDVSDSAVMRQPSVHSVCGSVQDQVTALCLSAVQAQLAEQQQQQQQGTILAPGSQMEAENGGAGGDSATARLPTTAISSTMPTTTSTQNMFKQLQILHSALELHLSRPAPGLKTGLGLNTDLMLESCLREFVRIQTVSSNPRLRDECVRGAKYLAKLLESLGADVKVVRPFDDKNPVVIGRLGHDPGKPTICFYGHYDVQPAHEPDWRTHPFELNAVNEYLYGRGTSDNKGPVLAFIFAVKELMDQVEADEQGTRSLPVNIVFIFEGEEENGSIGFREAVTQNLRWFEGVQLIVISNTNWVGESVPCLTYGMRGMMSVSVTVSGPQRDVHSGNDGGVFCEPMTDLLSVLSTMMHPGTSEIKIPGFQDQVAPGLVDLAWSSLQQHGQGEFSSEGYMAALGVPALTTPPGARNLLEARWCRPSLSVVDIRPTTVNTAPAANSERNACYRFGPTRFSVIPHTAVGKISIRFVARQDPKHILVCLRNHIQSSFAKLGSPNKINVHVDALGNWWEADVSSKFIQMAEAAIRREWACEPLYVREGGTMPVASVLERLLRAPAIMIPMGQSSDSPHLANERIRRVNLIKGRGVIKALLEELAGIWQPGAPSPDLAAAAAVNGNHMTSACPALSDSAAASSLQIDAAKTASERQAPASMSDMPGGRSKDAEKDDYDQLPLAGSACGGSN